jgi:hypothetical protein
VPRTIAQLSAFEGGKRGRECADDHSGGHPQRDYSKIMFCKSWLIGTRPRGVLGGAWQAKWIGYMCSCERAR